MKKLIGAMKRRMYLRPCKNEACQNDNGWHTADLTPLGRKVFTGRWGK